MDSRPAEVTEDDYDLGMDIQGLCWGVGDIPSKADFREKRYIIFLQRLICRIKDYGSFLIKPPPEPPYVNPVCPCPEND